MKNPKNDFVQALVDEFPKFNEQVLRDFKPCGGWIGNFPIFRDPFYETRDAVRALSEGATFIPTPREDQTPMGEPVNITSERFRAVFPKTTTVWKRMKSQW